MTSVHSSVTVEKLGRSSGPVLSSYLSSELYI
jgi:hypothetical protein